MPGHLSVARNLLAASTASLAVVAYAQTVMVTDEQAALRDRLYRAYASQHAGLASRASESLIYLRDIRPALPSPGAGQVIDIGCGQGELVRLLVEDGYDAYGVDISAEQVRLARAAGVDRVKEADYCGALASHRSLAAIIATDLLEHLAKEEVLDTFDRAAQALRPGGVFVARVPNAGSPFGSRLQYGDFTHESFFTAQSVRQLAAAAGFRTVTVQACPPLAHGLKSAVRVGLWKPASGLLKLALAAETGVLHGHVVTQNLTFVAQAGGE